MTKPLLSIQNLEISLKKERFIPASKNISYDLQHNETCRGPGWEISLFFSLLYLLPANISRISAARLF
jgi:hypothetical protein